MLLIFVTPIFVGARNDANPRPTLRHSFCRFVGQRTLLPPTPQIARKTMASSSDALSLDLSVLQALLKRNNSSHGRTLYFNRMKMAVRAIQRHLPQLELHSLRNSLQDYTKKRQEWTMHGSDPLTKIKKELEIVKNLLEKGVPEIISRIDHAAEALFVEVSRGFFLPLCIVALGCLARMRILIMRMAREYTIEVQTSLCKNAEEIYSLIEPTFFETTLQRFLEPPTASHARKTKFNAEHLLKNLGLTRKKKTRKASGMESDDVEVTMQEEQVDDPTGLDETSLKEAAKKTAGNADDHDIGESVVGTVAHPPNQMEAEQESAAHRRQGDVADKNLDFLQLAQTTGGERKRKSNDSDNKKKKKRKKESKKKKKKDVFDEIFGDE